MNFQLSKHVDRNKIFFVSFGELEGRLDPAMAFYQKKVAQFKYNAQTLSSLLIRKPQYGANEVGTERTSVNEDRYIRITDIDENGLLKEGMGKTAEVKEAKFFLNNNDLLFARSGSVGRAYIHKAANMDYSCFYAGYMIKFVLDEKKINPDYAFVYAQLNIFKDWVNAIQRTVAQPNINAEEYKSLKIPVPPKEIQNKIVAKMDSAYATKKKKEAEARRLLGSIDEYLLGELGINLPAKSDNTLRSRIFIRQFSEVAGRFDAEYYQDKYMAFDKAIVNGAYQVLKIGDVITSVVSGSTPKAGGDDYEHNGKYHFIRLTNFDDDMEVNLSKSLFIKKQVHDNELRRSILRKGDVLFGIAGSIGKMAIYNHDVPANINQAIARLRFKDNANDAYMAYLLNSVILKYSIERNKRPVAQPNLNMEELKQIPILLPPLKKQTEIAKHIAKIRAKAKQLQQQAKTDLEQAKEEVEAMVLGKK